LNFLLRKLKKFPQGKEFVLKIDLPMELNNELGIINYEYPFNFKNHQMRFSLEIP